MRSNLTLRQKYTWIQCGTNRYCSSNSIPPDPTDDFKPKVPKKRARNFTFRGSIVHGRNEDRKGQIMLLPIVEIQDHILPCFEKLVRRDQIFDSLSKKVAPNTRGFALCVKKNNANFNTDLSHLYQIGTLASYNQWPSPTGDSPYVMVRSYHRLKRLTAIDQAHDHLYFSECQIITDVSESHSKSPQDIKILSSQVLDYIRRLQPYFPYNSLKNHLNSRILTPRLLSYSPSDFSILSEPSRLQDILDENDLVVRLQKTLKILKEELDFFSLAQQLNKQVNEGELRDAHLFNLLRLRNLVESSIKSFQSGAQPNIQNEGQKGAQTNFFTGGGGRSESAFERKIKERLKNIRPPPNVEAVIKEELARITNIDKASVEYGVVQSYLDNLALVPWGVNTTGESSLAQAKDILNEDHYGLDEVKETILEHLAVSARFDKSKGRILCFVGPPGVGKTSMAKSIARALNRTYVRVSVGGIDDACEIKGHRRTYIGALPGKIVKGLQMVNSMDPVFCIDEIDKIIRSHRGDPNGSLLEAFDPEQNSAFLDHYLDLPIDLSKVLFVCTANSTATISKPLLDRMDVIQIPGYTSEEKIKIIHNYLVPSIIKTFKVEEMYGSKIVIDDDVFQRLTDEYFLEAGIRNTKKCIEKMIRKGVKQLDLGDAEKVHIKLDNITDYAGYPNMPIRRPEEKGVVGLVTGLSFNENYITGFTMDIECDFVKKKKGSADFLATGLAGKSLSESSLVAVSCAKKLLGEICPDNSLLEDNLVRIHFLEGGVQKDGPSAGVGIFCAVMSQALNVPVNRNLAMTGEVTLKGNVLAIGGVREKVTAAIRTGIQNLILPVENIPQFKQLSEQIKSKVNVTFVSNIHELSKVVFPSIENISNVNVTHMPKCD